ncbi:MAG: DUF6390 family protein [Dermatophilaceae bacterium]|nr:DUF6390 family protein [Intrasporangiaceae bacterium]
MTAGPVLFARYAYPPNALGYCGPGQPGELREQMAYVDATGGDDRGLRQLAAGFEGAWPYLQLIASANGRSDPLAADVVAAYWVGNRLLDAVTPALLYRSMEDRFRGRSGSSWGRLSDTVSSDAVPHHNFHVFAVYPWVGLLRGGRLVDEPLRVLDRCRVRWGQVVSVGEHEARIRCRPLTYEGHLLALGEEREEVVSHHGSEPGASGVAPGDWVSLHWDWVCDRLDRRGLGSLQAMTARMLRVANAPALPGAAALLG